MSNCERWFRRQHWRVKHYGQKQDRLRRLREDALMVGLPLLLLQRARRLARDVVQRARSGPVRT